MNATDLMGRVAIVTGAGKGIGRASALELAARGAKVVVNNRRHPGQSDAETSAQQTVDAIVGLGGQACANHEAVDAPGAGERMVAHALDAYGRLDVVVANAALPQAVSFHKQSMADFLQVFNVGFMGCLQLVHAAWPHMRKQQHGRVVVMTSSAGRYGNHGLGAYSASKAAMEMLMRSLAAEGEKQGILANAVSPYAFTQMTASYLAPEVARCLTPASIAPLVAWLGSDACTANGEVIVAGGGRFRRAYAVETDSLAGEDFVSLLERLRIEPGRAHPSSNHAFATLVNELRNGGQIAPDGAKEVTC